ncbi:hypothetical protein KW798_02335 [Candidatus Parcubacteria bacterium]|nr:hypothetical protein [Candidatus Parcubacteria bacterium]
MNFRSVLWVPIIIVGAVLVWAGISFDWTQTKPAPIETAQTTTTPAPAQATPKQAPSSNSSSFQAVAGQTFTVKVGESSTDGNITVMPMSLRNVGTAYPGVLVTVMSSNNSYLDDQQQLAKTWGIAPYQFSATVGGELIQSAKWAYSTFPDSHSATGIVRLKVVSIDAVAQTVTFQIITEVPQPDRG